MNRKVAQSKSKTNRKCKDETDISSLDDYQERDTFLKKKTKAKVNSSSSLSKPSSSSYSNASIGSQCDICLEYDKYTLTKCIQCSLCESYCHLNCYLEHFKLSTDSTFFICSRCNESQAEGVDYQLKQCIICNEYKGIVKKRGKDNKYIHLHCIVFIKELIEEKDNDNKSIEIRKWRKKSQCKLCKERISEDKAVIKCTNSKCQCYYHIPCANKLTLLYPIDFQYDFFGVSKAKRGLVHIPFYCTHHNKRIVNEYAGYISQMESVLEEPQPQFQPFIEVESKPNFNFYYENTDFTFNEENALSINFNPWVNNTKLDTHDDYYNNNDFSIDGNGASLPNHEYSLWNLQE